LPTIAQQLFLFGTLLSNYLPVKTTSWRAVAAVALTVETVEGDRIDYC